VFAETVSCDAGRRPNGSPVYNDQLGHRCVPETWLRMTRYD
jgi:hypothetical protein